MTITLRCSNNNCRTTEEIEYRTATEAELEAYRLGWKLVDPVWQGGREEYCSLHAETTTIPGFSYFIECTTCGESEEGDRGDCEWFREDHVCEPWFSDIEEREKD